MSEIVVEGQGLIKIYRRGREDIFALRGVDILIRKGEFAAIVGPSGSGKTALLNLLGCLDRPSKGSIRLNGIEVAGMSEGDLVRIRRENVGFVFQQFFLIPTLTARENIELPLLFSGKSAPGERIEEILEMVGLKRRGDHLPGQLSGGEMQRVAIGRALVNQPRILLADEPTGNLDSETAEMVYDLLMDMNREGLTVVAVTHNQEMAKMAGRTLVLRDGRFV